MVHAADPAILERLRLHEQKSEAKEVEMVQYCPSEVSTHNTQKAVDEPVHCSRERLAKRRNVQDII